LNERKLKSHKKLEVSDPCMNFDSLFNESGGVILILAFLLYSSFFLADSQNLALQFTLFNGRQDNFPCFLL